MTDGLRHPEQGNRPIQINNIHHQHENVQLNQIAEPPPTDRRRCPPLTFNSHQSCLLLPKKQSEGVQSNIAAVSVAVHGQHSHSAAAN